MEIMVIIVGWVVIIVAFVAYEIVSVARELFVKGPRCAKWSDKHNGLMVGSDEFFDWCRENGVNPNYYI